MDIASFENLFEKVPLVNVYSQKDVRERVQQIRTAINSTDENWEDRNKGLQELRSLLKNGHLQTLDDLPLILRSLEQGLQTTLKDLRSQVCREACLTIAYMAQKLQWRFETLAELLLPTLIQLIQNSFRIVTLSSATCAKYLLKNVQSSRLVSVLASSISNKSAVIRKYSCEFMLEILSEWERGSLERVVVVVAEFIKKGVSDADAEARMFSRKSFALFSEMFPKQGYSLLCSLEPSKQKQLLSEMENSNPLKTSHPSSNHPNPPPSITPSRKPELRTLQTPKYKAVQSQPSSRAASPGMAMLTTPDVASALRSGQRQFKRPPKRPGVSQSQNNSREASPVRRRMFESAGLSSRLVRRTAKRMDADVPDARSAWRGRGEEMDGMSETSSICSDHSYKSSCGPVNEHLREVLGCLSSGVWSERLEGVGALQEMVAVEGGLSAHELKGVLRSMTKLLHDPHPKVFNSSLDCLRQLCLMHHDHISEWLPSIFKRLLSKAGSEVLSYQQDKITAALNAIRCSFAEDVLFCTLCKFIVEQPQNISPKLKITVLDYLSSVCEGVSSISNNSDTRLALSKVVCWSNEAKNAQVRKLAQSVICSLHHNTQATFLKLLSSLPRTLQDSVTRLLAGDATPVRRRSLSRNNNHSPYSNNNTPYRNNDSANNNNNNNNFYNNNYVNKVNRNRYGNDDISDVILKAAEELQSLSVADDDACSYLDKNPCDWEGDDLGMLLEEIRSADDLEVWCRMMAQLAEVARLCVMAATWESHFKNVLLLLLEAMQSEEVSRRLCGLKVLRSLLHAHSHHFVSYIELTVMNLLEFEKETDRETLKNYEECTAELSRVLPHQHLVPMLPPVALTASHPLNMAAIKLLTKVIGESETDDVREFVGEVIPALVKGFENNETSVRKCSMVCLLGIHKHIGEQLIPLLSQLNPSKIKLLSLYIKRGAPTEDSPVTS